MNRFYHLPKFVQWAVAIGLTIFGFTILGIFNVLIYEHSYWWFLSLPLLVPFFQFSIAPIARLTGLYLYLSPMLLVYSPSPTRYDLHNGTAFDYWFVMRGQAGGLTFQRKLLSYYLEGFLNIIDKIEKGELAPDIVIEGSSYFFSDQAVQRLGFRIEPASTFMHLNAWMNAIDLFWMYSWSRGQIAIPDLRRMRKAVTDGHSLVKKKALIEKLHQRLSQSK